MWSVLNILEYHCLGDRESFTREWCDGYGNEHVTKPKALGDYLKQEGLLLRRRKSDVDHQLPPKHRISHYVSHDEVKYAELMERAMQLSRSYDQVRGWSARGQVAAEIEQETRRATGVAKADRVVAFVRSLMQAGEKPLIYAWHHDVHDIIKEGLSDYRIGLITGKQTPQKKSGYVSEFSKGNLDAMLLSLRATAGLDGLQSAATCIVFAELDWSPAVMSQCEDRAHRFGMLDLESLMVYYLVSKTGFDGVVMDALGVKVGQFVGIMGDDLLSEDQKTQAKDAAERHLGKIIAAISEESAPLL
jgi:SWI/SNF-related matrix-associated actin-dependent regulator 1 of chromatin subfamily A